MITTENGRNNCRLKKTYFLGWSVLFETDIPPEAKEISPPHPALLNGSTATAPPLRSISRPLCWQKKQQITFSWIVRLIIISRWRPLHYNVAKKRLTSFHIKIYNANTHHWVFVGALSALIFWMICQCACWLRCFLTWMELKRGPFEGEWLTFIHTDWKKLTCNLLYW